MKTIKNKISKLFLLLSIIVLFLNTTYAQQPQNNIWSLPPKYFNNDLTSLFSLSAPGGQSIPLFDDYDGLPAQFNHNAMQDKDGNLLFFVVDGKVFHANGTAVFNNEIIKNPQDPDIYRGYAETMIVPDPGNCQRYYIFTGIANTSFGGERVADSINSPETIGDVVPGYAILDLSITDATISNMPGMLLTPNAPPVFDFNNISQTIFDLPVPGFPFQLNIGLGSLHYAATKLNTTTNSRL